MYNNKHVYLNMGMMTKYKILWWKYPIIIILSIIFNLPLIFLLVASSFTKEERASDFFVGRTGIVLPFLLFTELSFGGVGVGVGARFLLLETKIKKQIKTSVEIKSSK